ncbi:porin [Thiomicrorhabdus sp. Milos-T2]|uniref:porin n=1 Tax=Thiomicrorhabdus sp. Milos-T2 TaxID=90814 RepID=UPI00068F2447|nr:porin [Thiomicrorhabdus sp. Milos-T2]
MKKNIIALAVASAIAAPVAMADAPVVYGQINVAIDSLSGDQTVVDTSANKLQPEGMKTTDRDSRFGIKGSEDLGNGLKAVYKMEFGVKVGDSLGKGSDSTFSGRNAYVGLAGGFGTVLVGRHDSPFKMSKPKDLFGDSTYADIAKTTMTGKLGAKGKAGENRFDDVVAYVSPSFAGIKLVVAGVGAEDGTSDSNLSNAYSAAAMYGSKKKGLYLAAAVDHADNTYMGSATQEWDHTRLSAQYATGGLIATGIWQDFNAKTADGKEGTNIQVGLGYKMGKFMPKVKYSTTDFKTSSYQDGSAYALGLNYALGKKTTAYVEYANSDKDMQTAAFTNSKGDTTGGTPDSVSALSVGMVHKF